jgi:hypothetical protein
MLSRVITEGHLAKIHSLLLANTFEASLVVWEKMQKAGQYRTVPMQAPKYPLTVYPVSFFVFVLFCFVLFCFVLFCFVLFCFVLFCFVLFVVNLC